MGGTSKILFITMAAAWGLAASRSATAEDIRKGPYLMYPGENSKMTVLWQTFTTQTCQLEWGRDAAYGDGMVRTEQIAADGRHRHTIEGLAPGGELHHYRLSVGDSVSTGSFHTAPHEDAQRVKFLAYGDTRTYNEDHNAVCAAMRATWREDSSYRSLVLHVGDFVGFGGSDTRWDAEYFDRSRADVTFVQANAPVLPCLGNHDAPGVYFQKYFPIPYKTGRPFYGSFDYGPIHVAVLNQYETEIEPLVNGLGDAQVEWLRLDLSASKKPWKIILLHEPGWSAGGAHPNNVEVQEKVQPLCERYGVSIIFAGHNHFYSRALVRGVHHVTTGAGGANLYTPIEGSPYVVKTAKAYEFCRVAIDGENLSLETIGLDGEAIDVLTIHKSSTAKSPPGALLLY